ncbi:serine/threonine-protein kinase [Anabaena sp. UHCC 0399]|uniref:serine/threonine-protein kinase n=1 Tax=Anabaena sp. UHCC 0399 TaxID=3110238 RepID=UPI002B2077BC|nr:serine/threonine-protein kinase [Anabaena sp. UHCC 0399]MEA5566455.1 serine/threonine-protein kinase [Anabaena sp. UHCC 0399]
MVWNPGRQLFGRRYIIEKKLGEGGIGITYLAKNKQGQLRVIKTLREEILNDPRCQPHQTKLKQDFKEEALRLALCRHPHIVEVENVFDDGDLPCMAMEYIQGEDLYKRITEKGALPEAEALQYIRQIGDALILVHDKGLLHRDLKPGNIMMRAGKPEAVLIDFGLARQFISGGVQQHTQSLTPGYAPPEQYAPIEERGEYIDVYALAATLYSLLTGQLPMPAPARLQNFTMQPPKDLNPSVSDRVNGAIMRGMALNYKFRPQSVQEWFDLLGVGIVVTSRTKQVTQTLQPPRQSPRFTPDTWECVHIIPGISGNIALSPQENILASVVADGVIHLWSLSTGQLIRTVYGNFRVFDAITFSSDGEIVNLTHSNRVSCTVLSPNGQILASWDDTTKIIKLSEVATGREISSITHDFPYIASIAFSCDGQILGIGELSSRNDTYFYGSLDSHDIQLWEVATGREIHILSFSHFSTVSCLAFSSDGLILASGSHDKTIKLWEVATGREIRTVSHSDWKGGWVEFVTFSPDGHTLVSGDTERQIRLWSVETGREIFTRTDEDEDKSFHMANCYALSPDGHTLAICDHHTIQLWSMETSKEIHTLTGHSQWISSMAFSPDGRILISSSRDETIRLWSVKTGKQIYSLTGLSSWSNSVAFSPNGRTFAGGSDNTIKLWSVETDWLQKIKVKEIRTLSGSSSNTSIAFSPDGRTLASGGRRTIKLWSVKTGEEIITLDHFSDVYSIAFSPDGNWLAAGDSSGYIKIWRRS